MTENMITEKIIGASIKISREIGPGLLESAYQYALAFELREVGFQVEEQVALPFIYNGVKLEIGYKIDLLVNRKVIVELKSVDSIAPVHRAQTLTYLRLSGYKLGLLINFNSYPIKNGIVRLVNNL